jgi:disease resistance protein RPS2
MLEKMPHGMNGCGEMEFPSGILQKLSHLQVFVLKEFCEHSVCIAYWPITVVGKEAGSLRNLEALECHFKGLSDFVEYLRSRDGILSLSTYKILVGMVDEECWAYRTDYFPSKTVGLGNLSINGDGDSVQVLKWHSRTGLSMHRCKKFM